MSKELIERLRDCGTFSAEGGEGLMLDAADALEQQQSWIASLEQNARDADKLYKELETELAEQQAREIEHHKDWVAHQTTRLDEAEKLIEQLREGLRKAAYMVRENTITPGGNPFALQEIEALAAAKQWKEK